MTDLTPAILLSAYRAGVFPMSESRDDPEVFWVEPRMRGVLPLDGFHISRSLAKAISRAPFRISFDICFDAVVRGCADRDETWINDTIFDLYGQLHAQGHAHSIEVWRDQTLVGGVYGVSIGAAFFGESMFSTATNASKIGLAYLTDHLRRGGYRLFDTQFITPHLASLGAVEITRDAYQDRLAAALLAHADWPDAGDIPHPDQLLQRNAQMS